MFERIIRFAIEQRWLVLLAVLAMAGLGIYSYQRLPIDAVPDITNVQVQINTELSGLSPATSVSPAMARCNASRSGRRARPCATSPRRICSSWRMRVSWLRVATIWPCAPRIAACCCSMRARSTWSWLFRLAVRASWTSRWVGEKVPLTGSVRVMSAVCPHRGQPLLRVGAAQAHLGEGQRHGGANVLDRLAGQRLAEQRRGLGRAVPGHGLGGGEPLGRIGVVDLQPADGAGQRGAQRVGARGLQAAIEDRKSVV